MNETANQDVFSLIAQQWRSLGLVDFRTGAHSFRDRGVRKHRKQGYLFSRGPRPGRLRTFRRRGLPDPSTCAALVRSAGAWGRRPASTGAGLAVHHSQPATPAVPRACDARRESAADEATHAWGSGSRQEGDGITLAAAIPAPTGARLSWARITVCRPGKRLTLRP